MTLGWFRARLGDRLDGVLAEVVAMLEEAAQSGLSKPEAGSAVKMTVKSRRRAVWGWQAFVNAMTLLGRFGEAKSPVGQWIPLPAER